MIRAAVRAQREAEHRYSVHVRIAVPPEGLGGQLEIMHAWLDETCGTEGSATAPAGTTGILNDALALDFEDTAVAHAFVARFCCNYRGETIARAVARHGDLPIVRRGRPGQKTP